MTPDQKKQTFSIIIKGIVFISIFLFLFLFLQTFINDAKRKENLLLHHGMRAIGTVYDVDRIGKNKNAYYYFYVNNVKYKNHKGLPKLPVKPGDQYLVVYYEKDPNINNILFNNKIKAAEPVQIPKFRLP